MTIPSTPLPQHLGRKNDRVFQKTSYYITEACTPQKTTSYFCLFEKLPLLLYRTVLRQKVNTGQIFFLLLLYRNIQSQKVNTVSELFSSNT